MILWVMEMAEIFPRLEELVREFPLFSPCAGAMAHAAALLIRVFRTGGKLLICGNGGSAADAEHIAGELMKGFLLPRPLPEELRTRLRALGEPALAEGLQGALPAVALSGASPLATAIANDLDARCCFAQQVLGLGRRGDALLAISTSGKARNVLAAAATARALGLHTLALTGRSGGELAGAAEVAVRVPADATYRVQEMHMQVYHAICAAVEAEIFGASA